MRKFIIVLLSISHWIYGGATCKARKELGTRPVGRLLFSLALPAITAQVVNVLYNMVDRMYIGHIPVVGATALTGLGVTLPVILLVSAFATLASMAAPPRLHYDGQGPQGGAERILGNCTMALVVMAVLLTAAILSSPRGSC